MTITVAQLRAIAGGKAPLAAKLVDPINKYCAEHGILDDATLMAHFLAHCAVETMWFTRLEENLNYTTTARLRAVWPSRFKSDAAAKPFIRNPKALAMKVYGKRKDLGNLTAEDGWDFRGRGAKQTTGRANYTDIKQVTGIDVISNPDLMADPDVGTRAAVIYFVKRVKAAAAKDDIVASTKAVQGGRGGLSDRRTALGRAKKALGAAPMPAPKPAKPKPAAPKAPVDIEMTKEQIERMQKQLRALGYTEIGSVDGKIGKLTRGGIALFKMENGIKPIDGPIDEAFLSALYLAPKRDLGARETATAEDIKAKGSPIIENSEVIKKGSYGVGIATVVSGVAEKLGVSESLEKISDQADQAATITNSVVGAVSSIVGLAIDYWWIAVPVACYFGVKYAKGVIESRVEDEQTGRTRAA